MKIRTRLVLGIGVINILLILLAASSVFGILKILGWERSIYEVHLVSIDKLIEADRDAYQSHLNLIYLLWSASSDRESIMPEDELLSEVTSNLAQVKERFDIFKSVTKDSSREALAALSEFDTNYAALQKATQGLLDKGAGVTTGDIQDYLLVFETLRNGLDLLTGASLTEAENEYGNSMRAGKTLLTFIAILTAAGLLLSAAILLMVVKQTLGPIRRFSDAMSELSHGNGDLTLRFTVKGNDEISDLSQNTNTFLNKSEEILIGLKGANHKSNRVRDGLVTALEENAAAATQITANVESISRQIRNQESNLKLINTNQDATNASLEKLSTQVESQSEMIMDSTSSITEMIASIKNLAQVAQSRKEATEGLKRSVNEGNANVTESNRAVQAIFADVDSILEMTKLISGIASQTNLLSMNAAIEAAHAGEAGKGFAVVADEIRKLAETSAEQSKSINSMLSQVIKNIEDASHSSGSTSRIFSELLEEFGTLMDAFNEISHNSQELDVGGRQILEAMTRLTEQSRIVDRETISIRESNGTISSDLQKITDGSLAITQATTEITEGIREVSQSLEEMRNLSGDLTEAMEITDEQLNLFKLSR
ncbi:MAG: HAMP domain-containing protein [Spirochaetales bacterium]|nr:HAMP domain-containing protein [Spirochaetales bacterium]